jgi:hypothetical protein
MNVTQKEMQLWLKEKLATKDSWAKRALLRIYEKQTELEKKTLTTIDGNDVGFNSVDAPTLSKIHRKMTEGRELNEVDLCVLKTKICRYAKQILANSDKGEILEMMICDEADRIRSEKSKTEKAALVQPDLFQGENYHA